MPHEPLIDTHVHLWDPEVIDYAWHADCPQLSGRHVFDQFDQVRGPISVEKIVFIECTSGFTQALDEVSWVTSLAENDSRLGAIVAAAPTELGEGVRDILRPISQNPLVRGVRRNIQGETDLEFCLRDEFVRGVSLLAEYDLHFEICMAHPQMPHVIRLVERCPQVRFILDHIGKPGIRDGLFEPWGQQMKELARLPNVWCKISGVVTEADYEHWKQEDVQPYVHHALECFGFDRVMYGSDWPVATLATGYQRWVETLDALLSGVSDGERQRLYRDNADAFYRLGLCG